MATQAKAAWKEEIFQAVVIVSSIVHKVVVVKIVTVEIQ